MENKKNNFEALYKKNDQLLRETETKLEYEKTEKQRLEWTTKNLNMELKSIKQKLQSLEDEKDILNQRCVKLKEERDNYGKNKTIYFVHNWYSRIELFIEVWRDSERESYYSPSRLE